MKNLVDLLNCKDLTEFNDQYSLLSRNWCKIFLQYFDANLEQDLLNHSVWLVVEPFGICNPVSVFQLMLPKG